MQYAVFGRVKSLLSKHIPKENADIGVRDLVPTPFLYPLALLYTVETY